ncbi:hypothetical protein BD410DRAFT_765526 [Rickenella mellea]|uniref:RecQ-mediated genome instability protein 1 n=1 Tax=Rickenella mellea TaxID=50990 RepID=A0A4Y7QEU0_9AGAM|nr:hypothetical protein BD410DRAFT_765526 [Rickenella mellea]
MVPQNIVQWISQNYPKPTVDPDWLEACYQWILDELHLNPASQLDEIIANVETQLLESDLGDSMLRGTGLPTNLAAQNNVRLRGPPVLVEIVSITEIASSAFSLLNVRQTRVDREDLAGLGEDDAAAEDEGPIPRYPRGMLRMELSDGSVTLPAIEYRSLPQLQLGETPLGFKVYLCSLTQSVYSVELADGT